jgi:hypothetical protein
MGRRFGHNDHTTLSQANLDAFESMAGLDTWLRAVLAKSRREVIGGCRPAVGSRLRKRGSDRRQMSPLSVNIVLLNSAPSSSRFSRVRSSILRPFTFAPPSFHLRFIHWPDCGCLKVSYKLIWGVGRLFFRAEKEPLPCKIIGF